MDDPCPLCAFAGTAQHAYVVEPLPSSILVALARHAALADALPAERLELWTRVEEGLERLRPARVWMEIVPGDHFAIRMTTDPQVRLTHGAAEPLEPLLLHDLSVATRIDIAVAFVWEAGLARIFSRLEECQERGGRIRFLTGDYGDATEPRALRRLVDLMDEGASTEVRIFETSRARTSFHPKAYLMSSGEIAVAYVGSSNLSVQALTTGVEWNLRVTDPAGVAASQSAFEALFRHDASRPLTDLWIDAYEKRRSPSQRAKMGVPDPEPAPPRLEPHAIQREALEALRLTREKGNKAGLVVLATGLGKTWLSAFDSEEFARVLFVAHREEILLQARNTYRSVRRDDRLGLFAGAEKDHSASIMFASIQTLSKPENLQCFDPHYFDYVVIDEFHHASARSYRRLIRHFEPKFLLGLTATPERTDGGDLLALCDENLVYRCDLGQGISRDQLCPFRYFGVADEVDYENIPWRSTRFDEEELTKAVATRARAENALQQWRDKGGKRTLGFCVSQKHADFMREFFVEQGVKARAVHSGSKSDPRVEALQQLEDGELEILFAVDMFNEGLDVRAIDTVLMLRPTESKILWLQQIGRGLRKADGKPYLTIIDYIGNHKVFLNKPAALFTALGLELPSRQLLQRLRSKDYELPPGCEVTYDLEAIEMLESLFPKSQTLEALESWYQDFRDQNGHRPTALEAYQSGFNPLATEKAHGSWFGFVDAMGDLSPAERKAASGVITALATDPMPRPDRWVVTEALLAIDALPGTTSLSALIAACQKVIDRSAVLRAELRADEALVRSASGDLLRVRGDEVTAGLGFGQHDREVLQDLLTEIVEWRLTRYVDERRKGSIRFKVLRNASDKAILKIDRKRYDLPEGWVTVDIGGTPYRANFAKEFVNVVAAAEDQPNELDALMREWFGPDAGKRGTAFSVAHEPLPDGTYRWLQSFSGSPKEGIPVRDDRGEPVDARFNVEELDDHSVTIVFMSRNKGRNDEYNRGLEIILERLVAKGLSIARIAVESGGTEEMSLEERTLTVEDHAFPLALSKVGDIKKLRQRIGGAMAKLGRAPGAKKHGGNSNKRIRLWVEGTSAADLKALIG